MEVRNYEPGDFAALVALWQACGLHPSRSDTPGSLERKLERDPDLFLVAELDGRLVASIIGSYDGRRGWINRLAVAPELRGQAIGRGLVDLVERRLAERGCDKVNLLVEPDNRQVVDYYDRLGYRTDELVFMEKWLA
ncbi:ribosomal protein S18 acetylase RimI-like enzyme [Stella humosa]|uniref:Ribosomal protein S18 acetylase RimI-like enzyme n=1 Tax=Stella humosa TaxID=94 RepID=A0A3N1KY43_9PROT|nr:GNAT family acetyltransferase [Stella humosa]ROP84352.1 ribosomal protein S18 acetylase RimI-like enzyme [Stella humosa]BBK33867.1 GNAT family acetyltransferase [Stella humosa]